jgi:hypothetical protein
MRIHRVLVRRQTSQRTELDGFEPRLDPIPLASGKAPVLANNLLRPTHSQRQFVRLLIVADVAGEGRVV